MNDLEQAQKIYNDLLERLSNVIGDMIDNNEKIIELYEEQARLLREQIDE